MLYKYLPVDRCHHWLIDKTAAFTALELLNDPYEGVILSHPYHDAQPNSYWEARPVVKYKIGGMTDYGVNPAYDPDADTRRFAEQEQRNRSIEERRVTALREIKSCRILSLSRTPDSMVMWAHYATNSRGLCIGIDVEKANLLAPASSIEPKTAIKPMALPVVYENEPFRSRFEPHENHIRSALGRKHRDWAYEQEVRIIRHFSSFNRYALSSSTAVGLIDIPAYSISSIVLGANPDESVRAMVHARIREFPHATLHQLEINSSGYSSRLRALDPVAGN